MIRGAIAAIAILFLHIGCNRAGSDGIRIVRVMDLLQALPTASIVAPAGDSAAVVVRRASVGKEQRAALFMHPVSSAEFAAVRLGDDAVFTAFVGIDDDVLAHPGDGVEFVVTLRLENETTVKVFSIHLNPQGIAADRGWRPVRVPLGPFAGQAVRVILSTGMGPAGDARYDWAVWGEPRIILDGL